MLSNNDKINALQETLAAMVGDWAKDNSSPANFVRKNGVGTQLCFVDRWCGGYQDVHYPVIIGWKAQIPGSSSFDDGVVVVKYPRAAVDKHSKVVVRERLKGSVAKEAEAAVETAIAAAKSAADEALRKLEQGR
jgi:hypothetical protein